MRSVFLTHPAVELLNVAIFSAILVYFVLRSRIRSRQRVYLALYFAIWGVFYLCYALCFAWLSPRSAYLTYGITLLFYSAPVFLLFAYYFPVNRHHRESRLVGSLAVLATVLSHGYYIAKTFGKPAYLNLTAQLWVFKGAADALTPLVLTYAGIYLWLLVLAVRKFRIFSVRYSPLFTGMLGLAVLSPALMILALLAFRFEFLWLAFFGGLMVVSLVSFLVHFVVFVNNSRAISSFVDKLLAIALVAGLLLILVIDSAFVAMFEQSIDSVRASTVELVRKLAGKSEFTPDSFPDAIRYVLAEDETGAHFVYTTDPLRVRELRQLRLPLAELPFRILYVDRNNPATYYIEESFLKDGVRYGVGFSYIELRAYVHDSAVYLLAVTLLIIAGTLVLLPFWYRRTFMNRVHTLLRGVLEVNQGNLNVRLPVEVKDELGSLSRHFNRMTISLRRLLNDQEELAAIQKELLIARNIQQATLPARDPEVPGLRVHGRYVSMHAIGGDLYDFHETTGGLGILVADVCGHGIPAALGASMAKLAFDAQQHQATDPGPLLSTMNQILYGRMQNSFLTASYAHLDAQTGRLCYSSAGHPPILLYREGTIEELSIRGPSIGLRKHYAYGSAETRVIAGDRLFFYTDGIIEARDENGELFGEDRLRNWIRSNAGLAPVPFAGACLAHIQDWCGGHESLDDDCTLVVVDIVGH